MPTTDTLDIFYEDLDRAVAPFEALHTERLQCKQGCSACCVDDITVFDVEAKNIAKMCQDILAQAPHEAGRCAFLDAEGSCRIYAYRPYVCRTQGLPLRWLDEDDGETVEFRDICDLNETEHALELLPADTCWEIGPFEGRLAMLQAQKDGGAMRRVSLRSLFFRRVTK